MDIIATSQKIQEKINESEMVRGVIKERITDSAKANAEYDKSMAKTIVQLLAGVEFELDGIKTGIVKATNVEKIAKGINWQKRLDMDTKKGLLDSAKINLDGIASELNGYQSINKHIN